MAAEPALQPVADERIAVLLVDDVEDNLVALEAILEPLHLDLVRARSGTEALWRLLDREYAVILLDVQMPEMDGFETAQFIKQRERTRNIPIIFLTAISKEERHVFRGYEVGAVDYVFKPFDPDVLRAKVAVFIDLYEKNRQIQRQAEQLREQELAEVRRESEERYRTLAEAMPQQVWTATPEGALDYVNTRVLDYFGRRVEDMLGWAWTAAVHPDDMPATLARWERSLDTGEPYESEFRLLRGSDETYRWHLTRALAQRDAEGSVVAWFGTNTDVDDYQRIQQARAFITEASRVLGRTLDYEQALVDVCQLAVPQIADWCAVHVRDGDGAVRQLSIAHVDERKLTFVRELEERYPPGTNSSYGAGRVLQTGQSQLIPEITDEVITRVARDELHLDLIRALGLRSFMCVPLVVRGEAMGTISFVLAESGRVYGEDDLLIAEEVARRAGTAIENARLYQEVEAQAQAARALAAIGDGVFLVDSSDVVRLWNPAAEAITGLPRDAVEGRRVSEAVPGWPEVSPLIPVAGAPGMGAAMRPETIPLEIDGRDLWLSISGVGVGDATVYAFRDLTEERVLEQMKSDFVATISHELRTPLAAIYGAAVTIRRPDLDLDEEMRDRLLGVIADESDRLAQIVNDVLLASHVDSGRLELRIEACDGKEIARNVVEAARAHLPEGVSLVFESPKRVPKVAADAGQLQQILVNLLDNAIKYSPDGGRVVLTLERAGNHLRFLIRDEGLGIPRTERNRIFEKFYRLDPHMTRGIGGTGLGLYIVRELVRRLDGRITVDSDEGKGSTFAVEIPIAQEARTAREKQAAPAS